MIKKPPLLNKGFLIEEILRNYFSRAGYYAIRGVLFKYENFDITDIDIWLYNRTSSVSREITIVDSKNKKTPQAMERIFWIQGLKIATSATNAIVATTDTRQEVKDFGKKLNITILDGKFLKKITQSDESLSSRLSDEDFLDLINKNALSRLDGNWRQRIIDSKSLLAKSLSFKSCNSWLINANFFLEKAITNSTHCEIALRCFYLICSFIAISIDYSMKELSFLENTERRKIIYNGFTYGFKNSSEFDNLIKISMGLITENIYNGHSISTQLQSNIQKKLSLLNTNILVDFFSKNEISKSLFNVAKELELLAMKKDFSFIDQSSIELRSMLFCLLDYWKIDRLKFSNLFKQ